MEAFAPREAEYPKGQRMGRPAMTSAGGEPHVVHVDYSFNAELETIDIHGYRMARNKKSRDVARTGKAAFVADGPGGGITMRPEDVGMAEGPRRRVSGLRREEVAGLSAMSTDYYARLEQGREPRPSEQMVASLARGLRLTPDERDHLFRLAGHEAPARVLRSGHVSPALMWVLDRLEDTPAQVVSGLAETLVQNRLAVALLGDQTRFTGPARSAAYRWFTDPGARGAAIPKPTTIA